MDTYNDISNNALNGDGSKVYGYVIKENTHDTDLKNHTKKFIINTNMDRNPMKKYSINVNEYPRNFHVPPKSFVAVVQAVA